MQGAEDRSVFTVMAFLLAYLTHIPRNGGTLGLVFALYFLPLLIASLRRATLWLYVALINLLLGWTVIGWIVAFLMAILSQSQSYIDFIQRTRMIIEMVRQAEQTGQWDTVRGFMSARLFQRWQSPAQGVNNRGQMPEVINRQITPAHPTNNRGTVRVTESQRAGGTVKTLWLFIRDASAQGGTDGQAVAAVCTNCGAPVDSVETSTCHYCGAALNLGHEWVLDDIRPDIEPLAA